MVPYYAHYISVSFTGVYGVRNRRPGFVSIAFRLLHFQMSFTTIPTAVSFNIDYHSSEENTSKEVTAPSGSSAVVSKSLIPSPIEKKEVATTISR